MTLNAFIGDVSASTLLRLILSHMELCVSALLLASLIAFPVGLIAARMGAAARPLVSLLGLLYTIPGLAMLALLVPFAGLGKPAAMIALVLYAQFMLVRHVILGLQSVGSEVLEAGAGLGMSSFQRFWRIEVPLALPIWITGLRLTIVSLISIATTAAWINAGGLGELIFEGLARNHPQKIVLGAITIALLSLVFEQLLRDAETVALLRARGEPL